MTDLVRCPNLCFYGKIKIFEYERAFYDLIKCKYCKGKGKVTKNEADKIQKEL